MSLYNLLFGTNPLAGVCLSALGLTTTDSIPRFRDAYLTGDGKIAIHTRTGGGNRDMYEHESRARENYPEYFTGDNPPTGPWNADLRKLPGFEYDEDDDFDSTYATFYFVPRDEWKPIFDALKDTMAAPSPGDRWQKMLDDMRAGGEPRTEEGKRALEVGEKIVGQLSAALAGKSDV